MFTLIAKVLLTSFVGLFALVCIFGLIMDIRKYDIQAIPYSFVVALVPTIITFYLLGKIFDKKKRRTDAED